MRTRHWMGLAAGAAALSMQGPARASQPAGVWIIIEEATILPDADHPSTLRLVGKVTLHSGQGPVSGWGYPGFENPAYGALYYTCPTGKDESLCQEEWRELVAAKGTCVGFGGIEVESGHLRPVDAKDQAPDVYPISMGVVRGHTPCQLLEASTDAGADTPPATTPMEPVTKPQPSDVDAGEADPGSGSRNGGSTSDTASPTKSRSADEPRPGAGRSESATCAVSADKEPRSGAAVLLITALGLAWAGRRRQRRGQ